MAKRPIRGTRPALLRMAGLCLVVLILAPWARATSAPPLERVTVQLNWMHQFEFAAFYAAIEHGYYRQFGLDISVKEGLPGTDAVREVVEGRADFGIGAPQWAGYDPAWYLHAGAAK